MGDVVEVLECRAPQQRNGYDCGASTLGFAEALLSDLDDWGFTREQHEGLLEADFNEGAGRVDLHRG